MIFRETQLTIPLVNQVSVQLEKSGEDMQMHFPITVATVPFRIPNITKQPQIKYGSYNPLAHLKHSQTISILFP